MLTLPEKLIFGYWDSSVFGDMKISNERLVTDFEIELHLENGAETITDDKSFKIIKNYLFIAKPGERRRSVLPLKTAYVKFYAEGELAEIMNSLPRSFPCFHYEKFMAIINEMLSYKDNLLLLHSRLLSLINLVVEDAKLPPEKNSNLYIAAKDAKKYIENHYFENIKLKDIADSVHLSEIYFHNIFTETFGISPHKYLIDYRINKAKLYLAQNEKSISEIAELTGFGCQQYFNKAFKKETGMTPASFRKNSGADYIL